MWLVGEDARAVQPAEICAETFEGKTEDECHIFLSAPSISNGPVWQHINGKQVIDFQSSYAVQLVPSVVAPDRRVLLQGRIAILRPEQYDDSLHAEKLVQLFRRLRSSLKQNSDDTRCIVQSLSNGKLKKWTSVLVGKGTELANMELKQFAKGEVTFKVESI